MRKHSEMNELDVRMEWRVSRFHQKCTKRRLDKACLIRNEIKKEKNVLINSKTEYNRSVIPDIRNLKIPVKDREEEERLESLIVARRMEKQMQLKDTTKQEKRKGEAESTWSKRLRNGSSTPASTYYDTSTPASTSDNTSTAASPPSGESPPAIPNSTPASTLPEGSQPTASPTNTSTLASTPAATLGESTSSIPSGGESTPFTSSGGIKLLGLSNPGKSPKFPQKGDGGPRVRPQTTGVHNNKITRYFPDIASPEPMTGVPPSADPVTAVLTDNPEHEENWLLIRQELSITERRLVQTSLM